MRKLIGISGKIGCGKTTLSKQFTGNGYKRIAFGDLLKRKAAERFCFPVEYCYNENDKQQEIFHPDLQKQPTSVRRILQNYGQQKRNEKPNYWVHALYVEMLCHPLHTNFIIDDVRYPNEARLIRDHGGILIRLEPYPGWVAGKNSTHESETALDNWLDWDLTFTPIYQADFTNIANIINDHLVMHYGNR